MTVGILSKWSFSKCRFGSYQSRSAWEAPSWLCDCVNHPTIQEDSPPTNVSAWGCMPPWAPEQNVTSAHAAWLTKLAWWAIARSTQPGAGLLVLPPKGRSKGGHCLRSVEAPQLFKVSDDPGSFTALLGVVLVDDLAPCARPRFAWRSTNKRNHPAVTNRLNPISPRSWIRGVPPMGVYDDIHGDDVDHIGSSQRSWPVHVKLQVT